MKKPFNISTVLCLFALALLPLAGCADNSMDNKVDESKLPPKPANGGPVAGPAAAAPAGGAAAAGKPAAN